MSAARRHEGVYILFQRRVVYIEVAPDRYAVFKIVRPEVGVESAALVYQCTDFSEGFADGLDLVESALTFEDWAYELVAAVYRSVGYYFPVAARRVVVAFNFAGDAARTNSVAQLSLIIMYYFKLYTEAAAKNKIALWRERAIGEVFGVNVLDETVSDSQKEGNFLSAFALVKEAAHFIRFCEV